MCLFLRIVGLLCGSFTTRKLNFQLVQFLGLIPAERNLLKFSELMEHGTLEEKKEVMHFLIKEIRVSRVNHKKGKAPTEVGAFAYKLRTSWFKIVTTLFAIPSIPVTYDEGAKKFVFNEKWLPEDDAYQIFLEDEFSFEIALTAKGQKRLVPQIPEILKAISR